MSSTRNPVELTPEIIALRAERQRKKEAERAKSAGQNTPPPQEIIAAREWIDTSGGVDSDSQRVLRFQTWNMLAQTLVRRELFPASDCLKASHREPMTIAELTAHSADVLCLQEVDRLDKILPPLHAAGYAHTYAAGPRKLHGCMIVYRDALLEKTAERVVHYDQLSARPDMIPGVGRITKNIALILALRDRRDPTRGCVVATTHLFWHPSYTYERVRQIALLVREVRLFRAEHQLHNWPCFVVGDFNFQPADAGYALLTGTNWTPAQESSLAKSRVVHVSVDPSIEATPAKNDDDEGGGGETDPDRILVNCRAPRDTDGLLTLSELRELAPPVPLRSAYSEALRGRTAEETAGMELYDGAMEPRWTSYTHYWRASLDYLFMLDPESSDAPRPRVQRLLKPLRGEDMEPGLPKRGVCASDHMSLAADISI